LNKIMIISKNIGTFIGPYIYVIVIENFLYIGETQKLPIIRWGQHFSRGGSLSEKLKKQERNPFIENNPKIVCISCFCDRIFREVKDSDQLRMTQYLEDCLHNKTIARLDLFKKRFSLVSDTRCTAPRSYDCKYYWKNEYCESVFLNVVNRVNESL